MALPKPMPLAAPQPDVQAQPQGWLVNTTFILSSPVTMQLRQGQILTDGTLVRQLLAAKAPLTPIGPNSQVVKCPCCQASFILPE